MIKVGEQLVLSLWDEAEFEAEVGPISRGPGVAPFTLAHNVATRERGRRGARDRPRRRRGPGRRRPCDRDWGGYTGYFADPDGFRWEIACNPGPIGQVVLP